MLYVALTATIAMLYTHAAIEACKEDCSTLAHRVREIGLALAYWGICCSKGMEIWVYSLAIQHSAT